MRCCGALLRYCAAALPMCMLQACIVQDSLDMLSLANTVVAFSILHVLFMQQLELVC
jgi:hypothetical protein